MSSSRRVCRNRLSQGKGQDLHELYRARRYSHRQHGATRLFAWFLDDPNILLTSYVTDESRILLHRNIQDRVTTIAPFLKLDHDPYIVASGGRLFWIQDAYTTSNWFPYARRTSAMT